MKLVHVKSNDPVVELNKSDTKIFSEIMDWDMKNNGIAIPEYLQEDYNDQFVVFFDDPLFQKAFKEVYYAFRMNHEEYKWVD